MTTRETRAKQKPTLFSLPETAHEMVLRIGDVLKRSGHHAVAIDKEVVADETASTYHESSTMTITKHSYEEHRIMQLVSVIFT